MPVLLKTTKAEEKDADAHLAAFLLPCQLARKMPFMERTHEELLRGESNKETPRNTITKKKKGAMRKRRG